MYNGFLPREEALSHITRTVHVPYTLEQMFALVADIEHYEDFLPYCTKSYILLEQGDEVEGALDVGYKSFNYTLITHNRHQAPQRIQMSLHKGPFSRLEGDWRFFWTGSGTRVELQLTVEFKHALMALALNRKLSDIIDKVVNAFMDRARVLYD